MIDQMAEGRSYHALKYLLDHREAYLYPFYPSCEVLGSLNAFRYQQDKLSDDDVQFYPSQLVILARYYLFHHQVPGRETAGMSLEETRRAMLEWIATLQGALMALSGKPITNASTLRLTAEDYSVPLYDETYPLECILADAAHAGPLDSRQVWPDPKRLPLAGGQEQCYPGGDAETFWRAQLTALAETEWYARGFREPPSPEDLVEMAGYRRVEAVLLMAVDYARRLAQGDAAAHRFFSETDVPDTMRRIRFENGRTGRALMAVSSPKTMESCLDVFHAHLVRQPTESGSSITFLFTDPAAVTVPPGLRLPALDRIDRGVRIRETDQAFYGLTPEMIAVFFQKAAPTLRVTSLIERLPEGVVRPKEAFERRYTFGDADPALLCGQMGKAAKRTIAKAYDSYRATMGKLCHALAESTGDILATVRGGQTPTQEQVERTRDFLIGWTNGYETVRKKAVQLCQDPTKAKLLLPDLLLVAWRFRYPQEPNRALIDALPERMRNALVLAEDCDTAIASLLARASTLLFLLLEDWEADGAPAFSYWYAAAHLGFSRSRLDKERRLVLDLVSPLTPSPKTTGKQRSSS